MSQISGKTTDNRSRWVQAMDLNRDCDVSDDEFTGTQDQFGSLDRDGVDFIHASEIE